MKFNKLIPEIYVSDIAKSINFYVNVLGFKIEYQRKEDKFVFLSLEGSQLMIQQRNNVWETGKLDYPFGRGINFQIEVKFIKPLLESLKRYDYPIYKKPKENKYRVKNKIAVNREFLVQDPDGYLLRFFEDLSNTKS